MKESQPKTIFLKEYTPPQYIIKTVDLRFDLDEDATLVSSRMRIRRAAGAPASSPLVLEGNELQLLSIKLDDELLDPQAYTQTESTLTVHNVPKQFQLQIRTQLYPQKNTSLIGLYKSSGNFCTQCEAEGFRNITFFIDRPDVLARYTTTVVADEQRYPVLLSNGNLLFSGRFDNGKHWVTWRDPHPKPSYLFALVAGDLACIEDRFSTCSGRDVDIKFYTQAHNADQCEHAITSLKKAMRWDEQTYGREYDLDIYMVVAVDDFNMGAMENKGLNVFNTKYVLAKPETATDSDFLNIESVIGHEYFHNWSGNRVTCRDWFQLSLKEGFTVFRDQEFSADMGSRGVQRIEDVNILRTFQFREDAGPMAHPVRPDSYEEINNFYTMTVYNKGAEVVRMLHHLVGQQGFRQGTDLYFERHDGEAVTTDDFVKAIEDANHIALSQFKRWYSQAGTPVVEVERDYDETAQTLTLSFRQHCPSTPGQQEKSPFHIPIAVGLLDRNGRDHPINTDADAVSLAGQGNCMVQLREPKQKIVFRNLSHEPVPSVLRGFSAPVKLNIALSDEERCFLMSHDSDPFNRWEAGQQLAVKIILHIAEDIRTDRTPVIPDIFVQAFAKTLTGDNTDRAMTAEILSLPSENYLAEFTDPLDPYLIHQSRLVLARHLASELRDDFSAVYMDLVSSGSYTIDPQAIGRRALRNTCLGYLMETEDPSCFELAKQQLEFATNMTDELAALSCLIHTDNPHREPSLQAFYEKWKGENLVMDKWLSIQALSRLPDVLDHVKALLQHPVFSLKNPNKTRALIASFSHYNVHFHQRDGSGYAFLADKVLELDGMNPQVAARLVNAFTTWRRLASPYREAMHQALIRIGDAKLSKDVFEIVHKSLGEQKAP